MMRRTALASALLSLTLAAGCAVQQTAGPAAVVAPPAKAEPPVALPMREGSLKFAVLGDFGSGTGEQYALAATMARTHQTLPFTLVLLTGDNIYGSDRPQDMEHKFAKPYKPLLDAGVKFYASLGNHDDRNQRFYPLFNMDEKLYYSFKAPQQDVRFFALESGYLDVQQIGWIEREMAGSSEKWKIPYFHHPLYSSGERHGSQLDIRRILEPMFVKNEVSVVFAGHDHFYERTSPQNGIVHFVVGSGGQLRRGNIDRRSPFLASGFDTDQAFLAAEIDGDELFFNVISRTGQVVDSGVIRRRDAQ